MAVPESNLTEVKPRAGFTAIRARGIPVYVGVSSKGPFTPQSFGRRKQKTIASTYGAGPMSREGAYCASQTSQQCVCLRVVATPRAASKPSAGAIVANGSSTFTATLSGTPTDGADVVIKFGTVGGNTATGPIAYSISLDGGVTFGSVLALGTATSITILGVSVALGSNKVVTAADTISWLQRAASQAVLPQTLTKANASTATYAVTGTPNDAYRVRLEWLTGGTLGTAGATFRYCLDWDGFSGSWVGGQLGTSTTILPLDGVEPSGLTITLSTGGSSTVDALDVFSFNTTAPEAQWSDISAALTVLRASGLSWSFLAVMVPLSATDAGSLDTLLTGWATGSRRTWAVCETRDRETTETVSAWAGRVRTDFASFASTRVFPAAGHAPDADPITGRHDRRSSLLDYVTRLVSAPSLSTDPGEVAQGALPASRVLHDPSGAPTEYDADADPQLFDAHGNGQGFLVLRTFEDDQYPGTYPAGGICMPSAGDLGLVAIRRVLDAFEDAIQSQARAELVSRFRRWTAVQVSGSPKYKSGDIYEADARGIERRLNGAAVAAVMTSGDASGVTVVLTRTPISLGGGKFALAYDGQCTALGYIYEMDGTASLADPALGT